MVVTFIILLLLLAIFLGMPIAFALAAVGSIGIGLTIGMDGMVSKLSTTAYRSVADSTLASIPLFVLMAELMNRGGMARDVFSAANRIVGNLPGGVAMSAVLASAGFAAVSGSSTAASGTLAAISLPEFKRLGYSLPISTGVVAVAGTLAVMIPPSIAMIIYGIMTQTSIGKLLVAGVIPGAMTAVIYIIAIYLYAKVRPRELPRGTATTLHEKLLALKDVVGFLFIVGTVFVTLYAGIATTTETAAVAAAATYLYLAIAGRLSRADTMTALLTTLRISAMMLTIVFGALVFGYFLTINRVAPDLVDAMGHAGLSRWSVMACVIAIYLVLGMLMDQVAILLITLPVAFPLVTSLGFDPIWFGVIVVKLVEIGLITPPVGMNVFVVSGATGVPVGTVFRGTAYLLGFEFITLALLLSVPAISTWLPSLMGT
ncbi:MAG: dicarboxylate transporter, DctM subunit [Rhodoferax sp.]|nr:dicarboxylate transporter, DctM subunit [Rhodoferax sp.]